ncbi:HPF/RaiA family ribosome-associated protein [Pricia sp. S334]|uniref:HPF/RaiA family ribosome-associated protein n=1 Tax=Pricia mediterranea TaxID=3076079 RepID=A0ABU3L8I0_9FLAO|nr:HPF/RaiA family ribosome-associated protein [Pricia sp. S334]MDT7830051.1 HPF/RaiA family ribosome-associated protein [Pricia sp. S334]
MTIEIQYVRIPTSESLDALATKKLNKLAQKYDWLIRAQVHFKLENVPAGNGKICEIELSAPGPRLFAKSSSDDFEKSLAETVKELEGQLRKKKTMMQKR